uniref:Hexosyltransferase n=1 Tax=Panagrolaimus sp. JU765 TaxID=591449 RepID=A0AC34R521_9BILA
MFQKKYWKNNRIFKLILYFQVFVLTVYVVKRTFYFNQHDLKQEIETKSSVNGKVFQIPEKNAAMDGKSVQIPIATTLANVKLPQILEPENVVDEKLIEKPAMVMVSEAVVENDSEEDKFQYDEYDIIFSNLKMKYKVRKFDIDCAEKNVLLVIPSRPNAFIAREAIRKSWLNYKPPSFIHKFLIGQDSDLNVRKKVDEEAGLFNDLIITDLVDSYQNLSLKVSFFEIASVSF